MPFLGLGLHVLVALVCAVHAIRTRQQMYWLLVLFSFPLLGSIVYFFAIFLPGSRLERKAVLAVGAAARKLDPGRELREAQAAYDYTPTAQNQMRLAEAQLDNGDAAAAAATYRACLQGAFGNDLEVRRGASRAYLANGDAAGALEHLEFIRRTNAGFRAEEIAVVHAQALAAAGRHAEARAAFEDALARFGASFTVQAECAIWAAGSGESVLARRLYVELQSTTGRWNRHTRDMNSALVSRLDAAFPSPP